MSAVHMTRGDGGGSMIVLVTSSRHTCSLYIRLTSEQVVGGRRNDSNYRITAADFSRQQQTQQERMRTTAMDKMN
jgi:hypothetical protein